MTTPPSSATNPLHGPLDRLHRNAGSRMRTTWTFHSAGQLFFGENATRHLSEVALVLRLARDFRPDGVLGLGGGSNMDLAKITALVLTHGGTPGMYFGDSRVPGPIM